MSASRCDQETFELSIQIPDGTEPGDLLSFESNGKKFTIEVPIASVAGEILQVKLASSSFENDEDSGVSKDIDTGKVTIEMITGSKITIIQTLQNQNLDKNLSDGTYKLLWPASRFILKFMNTPDFRHKILSSNVHSIIELGAGNGMLGIAFADIASSYSTTEKAMKLILTDVEEALPQLRANIRMNREVLERRADMIALPLKWHSLPIPHTTSDFDFILGSDLLYNCSAIPDLVATIRRLLCRSTKILISVRWRKPSEERIFFKVLSDIIDWKLVHGDCPLDHNSYGNGSFESNKYFSQSMVSIKGKVVPLALMHENNCEKMNDVEFDQFEELQTQIYLGEVRETRPYTDHMKKRQKLET